jgi:hypothetical protein
MSFRKDFRIIFLADKIASKKELSKNTGAGLRCDCVGTGEMGRGAWPLREKID